LLQADRWLDLYRDRSPVRLAGRVRDQQRHDRSPFTSESDFDLLTSSIHGPVALQVPFIGGDATVVDRTRRAQDDRFPGYHPAWRGDGSHRRTGVTGLIQDEGFREAATELAGIDPDAHLSIAME